MRISLPPMDGPPNWWDAGVIAAGVIGLVAVVRRAVHRG